MTEQCKSYVDGKGKFFSQYLHLFLLCFSFVFQKYEQNADQSEHMSDNDVKTTQDPVDIHNVESLKVIS